MRHRYPLAPRGSMLLLVIKSDKYGVKKKRAPCRKSMAFHTRPRRDYSAFPVFCSPFPLYPQKALSIVMNEHNEDSSAKKKKRRDIGTLDDNNQNSLIF